MEEQLLRVIGENEPVTLQRIVYLVTGQNPVTDEERRQIEKALQKLRKGGAIRATPKGWETTDSIVCPTCEGCGRVTSSV